MRASKLSALFLTTAMAFGMAGQANALDVGASKPFAQMEQTLAQEHQVEIARALYVMHPEDPKSLKLCVKFTINAQGEAYILLSNNMDDSKATVEMVYGKIENARAYDPHILSTVPTGVPPQSNLAVYLRASALKDGTGVMLHGQSVKKQADGTEQAAGMVTVIANLGDNRNPATRNGVSIVDSSADGKSVHLDPVYGVEIQYSGATNMPVRPAPGNQPE